MGLAVGDVLLAEKLDLAGDGTLLVEAGAYAFGLEEGVDLAVEEAAVAVDGDGDYGGVGGDAGEAHAVGGAEIAEAVVDEAVFIDFDGADDVWAVAIDDVGTVVDAEVCQLTQ